MKQIYLLIALFVISGCAVNKGTKSIHSFTGDSIGCGNFIVYKLSGDNKEYISVAFNAQNVEFDDFQAYGVAKTDIMEVKRRKYKEPISASLCNDVMADKPQLLLEESPKQGIVEIIVSDDDLEKAKKRQGYRVTIVLKKMLFENAAIDYLRIEDVYVGWLPG